MVQSHFGSRVSERKMVREAFREAGRGIPPHWRESNSGNCQACLTERPGRYQHSCMIRCGLCNAPHASVECRTDWLSPGIRQGRSAADNREAFRVRMNWRTLLQLGIIFRSGRDTPGRAFCQPTQCTVMFGDVERWVPPMWYGGVYVPQPVPTNLERDGVVNQVGIEALPESSQDPSRFLASVVWRGCRTSTRLSHWLAALSYYESEFPTGWNPSDDVLRLIWEAAAAGLRLHVFNYVEWVRAQAVPGAAPPAGDANPVGGPDPFAVQEGSEDVQAEQNGVLGDGAPEGSEYAPSDREDDSAALDAEDVN